MDKERQERRELWDECHKTAESILEKLDGADPMDFDPDCITYESTRYGDVINKLADLMMNDSDGRVGEAKISWDREGFILKYKKQGEKND